MKLLIKDIGSLVQTDGGACRYRSGGRMDYVEIIQDAHLLINQGLIEDFGPAASIPDPGRGCNVISAAGRCVLPAFCDPHTHIVFAGNRHSEFVDRIRGFSYEEIAAKGGGILNSAKLIHDTHEDELYRQSAERIKEIITQGTGAVEIKSGYGLNTGDEIKMLRVIRKIKENFPLEVKATFLGAHSVPAEYRERREKYIALIVNEMIPAVVSENLADYIDVFCDKGFFTVEETEKILEAGLKYGLKPKVHANELGFTGGVQTGVKYNALSVDHLEYTGDDEITALRNSGTMPTLLPGSAFFMSLPDPPARKMIDSGLPVALASDYNPGSCPSGNMKLMMSLACIRLRMTPAEALNAATINSAFAMGLSETHGSIARGKVASIFITKPIPSFEYLPYAFGSGLIETVILRGNIVNIKDLH
ncbi:MAG: imidazolonepropionase [Bacteroidales bacterium]